MTTDQPPNADLMTELRRLGHNLRDSVRNVWDSPERKQLQQELQAGLADLERGLQDAATELTDGPTGQKLRQEVASLRQRIENGDIQKDMVAAMQSLNAQLSRANAEAAARNAGDTPKPEP